MADFEAGNIPDPLIVLGVNAHVVTGVEDAAETRAQIAAFFQSLGKLTACEVAVDVLSVDPEVGSLDNGTVETAPEVDPKLTRGIVGVLHQFVDRDLPRRTAVITGIETILDREGVISVRDTLAVGRKRLGAARNAGAGTIKRIGEALRGLGYSDEWRELPSLTNIVRWYPDVLDVPGLSVDAELSGMTLREVLTAPISGLAEHYGKITPDVERAKYAKNVARLFVVRYLAERDKLAEEG